MASYEATAAESLVQITAICHNNPALLSGDEGANTVRVEADVIGPARCVSRTSAGFNLGP